MRHDDNVKEILCTEPLQRFALPGRFTTAVMLCSVLFDLFVQCLCIPSFETYGINMMNTVTRFVLNNYPDQTALSLHIFLALFSVSL